MKNNCFTCKLASGCKHTWKCYDDTDNFGDCPFYVKKK